MWKTRLAALVILLAGVGIGFFVYSSEEAQNTHLPAEASAQADFPFRFGLDLSGGTHLVYRADVSELAAEDVAGSMDVLRAVIERRVNSQDVAGVLGVADPKVQVEEGGRLAGTVEQRLIVELPGVTDVEAATDLIGETPTLEFMLLREGADIPPIGSTTTVPFAATGLTGRYLEGAQTQFQGGQAGASPSEPVVVVDFNNEGTDLFGEITEQNVGRNLAIFLDGRLISAPVIREAITGGQAVISGNFALEEARSLAHDLNFGALPVPIELISTQTIGPTLGKETLAAGIQAGIIGLVLVALFLVVWYRLPGLLAVISLSLYLIVMLALFKVIPVTLTAAGVAGFILSIGMAVDANVLIFERMKEELRQGKTTRLAIADGFSRAWLSIRDGNISSLITAVVIFYAGTFLTRGFAVTLGLGVLLSMLTAITVSRTLLLAIGDRPFQGATKMLWGSGFKL